MKKTFTFLLLLLTACWLGAQTVFPPSKPTYTDGNFPSSLLFNWEEGMSEASKIIEYDTGDPVATNQLTSPYRINQTQDAVKFTVSENTIIERIRAFVYFNYEATAIITVKILGTDVNGFPDLTDVKATFTQTVSPPASSDNNISSWVELCPTSQIAVYAQDPFFVVLTASRPICIHHDVPGNGQGFSYMKRSLDANFLTIEDATMRNANWMIRLQTNNTLTTAPSQLQGYNLYKNGIKLNNTLIPVPQYQENGLATGLYSYYVKAVYGGVETNPSEALDINYKASITYTFEDLPTGAIPEGCISVDGNSDNYKFETIMTGVGGAASYTGRILLGTSAAKLLDEAFIMPYVIPTAEDHIISLWGRTSAQRDHIFQIKLSTTGKDITSFETVLKDSVLTTSYKKYTCDLSAYIGQKIALAIFVRTTGTLTMRPMIDDIVLPPIYKEVFDVTPLSINAPDLAVKAQETTLTARVKNMGNELASDVKVKLVDMSTQSVLATSATGTDIKVDSTKMLSLSWTPATVGNYRLKIVTLYDDDAQAGNDSSNVFHINVQDENSVLIYFGNKENTGFIYPLSFPKKNSGSQTLFYPDEMGQSGAITAIAVNYNFTQDVLNQPIKVWMGETNQTDLNKNKEGYINPATLQLVFSGNLNFYADRNTILIPFTNPYKYNYGNLVVSFENEYTDETFPFTSVLFYNSHSTKVDRTAMWGSDEPLLTFEEQKANSAGFFTIQNFPDVHFVFNSALVGTLRGYVTDVDDTPIANAKVELQGTHMITYTDQYGEYTFHNVNAGSYTMAVSKYPFVAQERPVTIVAGVLQIQSFQLVRIPVIDVTGRIMDKASQMPVADAYVSVDNNTDKFFTTTSADGTFVIQSVLQNQTYLFSVIADSYVQHYQNVSAATTNIDLGTIELSFNAAPATSVRLSMDNGNAVLNWNKASAKNGFSEDFEGYQDFTLDFTPFRTIDVDQYTTTGFMATAFPHRYEKMAYIVFNSTKTTPPMNGTLDGQLSYSGQRIAATFCTYNPTLNPVVVPNNDWLISPQTKVDANAKLEFEARGFRYYFNGLNEKFKVMVSTTGHNIADFTEIAHCDSVPYVWTHYSYDLSAYAGQHIYIALQSCGFDAHMFMLDDFRMVYPSGQNDPDFVKYKIYRLIPANRGNQASWVYLGETTNKTYTDPAPVGGTLYAIVVNYTNNRISEPAFSPLTPLAVMTASTDSLIFNNVPIGTTSASQTIEIVTDNMQGDIHYSVTGNDGLAFPIEEISWDPGSGGFLSVSFKPTETRPYCSQIVFSSPDAQNITVDLIGNDPLVGVADAKQAGISVYPNPASDKATITAKAAISQLTVYNSAGQLVKAVKGNGTVEQICDFSTLAKGTYYVKVETTAKKTATVPVVVN